MAGSSIVATSSHSIENRCKQLYEADLKSGSAGVPLPYALGRKYPNAAKDWAWYWIFPASKLYLDPRSGYSLDSITDGCQATF